MNWKLDDNARSGIHYLVLGVAAVAALRALWWGIFAWDYRDLSADEIAFHNGYLGFDGSTLVVARSTPAERTLTTLAIILAVSLLGGLLASLLGRQKRISWFRRSVVIIFLITLPWAIWAALFAPLKYTTIAQDLVVIHYRPELLLGLPMPFGGTMQPLDRSEFIALKAGHGGIWNTATEHVEDIRLVRSGEVIGTVSCPASASSVMVEVTSLRDRMLERLNAHFGLGDAASDL